MSEPICVGFVGENGAGKSTAMRLIRSAIFPHSFKELRFSSILAEGLKTFGITESRENLQVMAQLLDSGFGKGTLSRALVARAKNMTEEILFLDGVRWLTDEEAVRSFKQNLIIYVTAPQEVRFKRLLERKEKSGEDTMTWEQFLKEDSALNEQFTSDIGSRANFTISNPLEDSSIQTVIEAVRMRLGHPVC
ncbi:MAG TPA: AAA family ATPase [Candidatus Paceibacterota bacterium]|nr:AAA family ATPase [Candidatus Paceibacterota bacterium]